MIKSGQTTRLQVEKATNTILDRVEALLRSSKPKDQLAHLTLLAALNPPAPTAVWKTAQDVILGIILNTQQNDSSVQKSRATERRYWSRLKHANLLHFRDPKYNDTRSGTASVSAAGIPGTDPLDLDGVARCLASFTRIGNDPLLPNYIPPTIVHTERFCCIFSEQYEDAIPKLLRSSACAALESIDGLSTNRTYLPSFQSISNSI
jgi:hypothetical protein